MARKLHGKCRLIIDFLDAESLAEFVTNLKVAADPDMQGISAFQADELDMQSRSGGVPMSNTFLLRQDRDRPYKSSLLALLGKETVK